MKKWLPIFLRCALYILCGFLVHAYAYTRYIPRYTTNILAAPAPEALFVDAAAANAPVRTGSFTFPFATITAAVAATDGTTPTTIIVVPGTYHEHIVLKNTTTLYGSGDADVTITDDPTLLRFPLTTAHRTRLINIRVEGGRDAIVIPYGTHARITRAVVTGALEYGILMIGKSGREQDELRAREAERYEFFYPTDRDGTMIDLIPEDEATALTITQSTIAQNHKQGLYLKDGIVVIDTCLVEHNGEEGIDLHPHTKAVIVNTISRNNGESGLESEIYDTDLTIVNSTFSTNAKNGLAFLTSVGTGSVTLQNVHIADNATYGIRCARHKNFPRRPRPFFASVIDKTNVTFADNGAKMSSPCVLF